MDRKGRKALHPCVRQMLWYTFSFYSPKRRAQIAEEICGVKPACLPGDMLTAIRKREGFKALLLSEWILFGGCVIVCLLLDLLFVHRNVLWKILGLLACMIPFFFCEEGAKYLAAAGSSTRHGRDCSDCASFLRTGLLGRPGPHTLLRTCQIRPVCDYVCPGPLRQPLRFLRKDGQEDRTCLPCSGRPSCHRQLSSRWRPVGPLCRNLFRFL